MSETTQSRSAHPTPRHVVMVGHSDAEQSLRRLEDVELTRARTGVDAIGELAQPLGECSSTSVVVMPGALDPDELPSFLDAMRLVDPDARLIDATELDAIGVVNAMRCDCNDQPTQTPTAETVLTTATSDPPALTPPAPVLDLPDSSSAGAPVSLGEKENAHEDASIIDVILSGGDPINACMDVIRAKLNDPTVQCLRAGGAGDALAGNDPDRAIVSHRGVVYGVLTTDRDTPAALLKLEANHLAGWLSLAKQQRQLRSAAFTDQLTGAWNRRYFDYFLTSAINNARRLRHDVTIMVYDIDNFKRYNDLYGHAAGDEILSETVRLLISVIRPTDRVCRIGGDEFVVIFDDPKGPRDGGAHHPTSIAQIALRFQKQICAHHFPKLGLDAPGTLTISGGLATYPWDGSTPETLLERADQLALESKRMGKNIITFGPGARCVCGIIFPDDT